MIVDEHKRACWSLTENAVLPFLQVPQRFQPDRGPQLSPEEKKIHQSLNLLKNFTILKDYSSVKIQNVGLSKEILFSAFN